MSDTEIIDRFLRGDMGKPLTWYKVTYWTRTNEQGILDGKIKDDLYIMEDKPKDMNKPWWKFWE